MSTSKAVNIDVSFSQESLYFPLPLTDVVIENVVAMKNLLPAGDNPMSHAIAFKVMCPVRNRYLVRPATGFILPGQTLTASFLLSPDAIRADKDPNATLPTADTKDLVFVDLAIVPPAKEAVYVAHAATLTGGKNMTKAAQEAAAAFWKARGPVKPQAGSACKQEMRKRLTCIFPLRSDVPQDLTMRMISDRQTKRTDSVISAQSNGQQGGVELPPSRASLNNRSQNNSTAPPSELPRRLTKSNTPKSLTDSVAGGAPPRPPIPSTQVPPLQPPVAPTIRYAAPRVEVPAFSIRDVLNYKISYKIAAVLVLLAVVCGFLEHHTLATWLIAGK